MAITTPIDQTSTASEPTATAATWAVIRDFARRRTLGAVGAAVVVVMIVVGVFAGLLAPYDPLAVDFGAMLSKPNAAHWLGTDAFGRDRRSRLIYGSRTTALGGFGAPGVGATVGAGLGGGRAYFGGRVGPYPPRPMGIFFSF